jgi:hypothetical protein
MGCTELKSVLTKIEKNGTNKKLYLFTNPAKFLTNFDYVKKLLLNFVFYKTLNFNYL